MKRFIFILLILITLCSVFTVSIFAENEDSAYDDGAKAGANLAQGLNQAKEELWGFLEQTWDFIMSDETYKELATAVLGILAFIFIPKLFASTGAELECPKFVGMKLEEVFQKIYEQWDVK